MKENYIPPFVVFYVYFYQYTITTMKQNISEDFTNLFDRHLQFTESEKEAVEFSTGLNASEYLEILLNPASQSKFSQPVVFDEDELSNEITVKYFNSVSCLHFVVLHGISDNVLIRKFKDETQAVDFFMNIGTQAKNQFLSLTEQA